LYFLNIIVYCFPKNMYIASNKYQEGNMKRRSLGVIALIVSVFLTTSVFAGEMKNVSESLGGARSAQGIVNRDNEVKPTWGGVNQMVKTIQALSCQTTVSSTEFDWANQGGVQRRCTSGFCSFECTVDLPSGAAIAAIELDGCDLNNTDALEIALVTDGRGNNNYDVIAYFSTGAPATDGCTVWTYDLAEAYTVDNYNESYLAEIYWDVPGSDLTFSAVRIYYSLQVSPAPANATFSDVSTSHQYFQFIEALADSGITAGYPDGTFRPGSYVTRGQMAVFLSKALGLYWPN
jgi:hypothetical protein